MYTPDGIIELIFVFALCCIPIILMIIAIGIVAYLKTNNNKSTNSTFTLERQKEIK